MNTAHETILTVDLSKLDQNCASLKAKLNPNTKIIAVLKAYGYGHGDLEIAKRLEKNGVFAFWVADFEEGINLRKGGVQIPVIVANPGIKSYQHFVSYKLEPVIYSFRLLTAFSNKKIPFGIHIKFNTGMNRFGFELKDVKKITDFLSKHPQLKIKSICSHLSASDNPKKDIFTNIQFRNFEAICDEFESIYKRNHVLKHILNSNGLLRFRKKAYNAVRIGIGFYGICNDSSIQQIGSLTSVIAQIRKISKNQCIGYGAAFTAKKDMQIAIIPFGYADGLNRRLGEGIGSVVINTVECSIIGKISMDSCLVDVTKVKANEGDTVEIFGKNISVFSIAKKINTIPYEILSVLNRRIKRHYLAK